MKKCKDCDPFENYDALVILTRQGGGYDLE